MNSRNEGYTNEAQTYTLHTPLGAIKVSLVPGLIRSRVIVYWSVGDPSVGRCWAWKADDLQAATIAKIKAEAAAYGRLR